MILLVCSLMGSQSPTYTLSRVTFAQSGETENEKTLEIWEWNTFKINDLWCNLKNGEKIWASIWTIFIMPICHVLLTIKHKLHFSQLEDQIEEASSFVSLSSYVLVPIIIIISYCYYYHSCHLFHTSITSMHWTNSGIVRSWNFNWNINVSAAFSFSNWSEVWCSTAQLNK